MANIRINDLPADAAPSALDVVAIDQATTRKATIQDVCDVGVPIASTPEAEAGIDAVKRMTPATTAAAIATRGAGLFATQAQGNLADTAVQPGDLAAVATSGDYADLSNKPTIPDVSNLVVNTRAISAGTGLTGGGNLTADRSFALSAGSIASLSLADTAVQPGALGALASKDQIDVLDVDATGTPSSSTFWRGDGTWAAPSGNGDLLAANNLSDLDNAATARTNLGLGNVNNTSDASKPISTATQAALNLKANLASPAFSGSPTAPTQSASDNSTQIATTAFVQALAGLKPIVSLSPSGQPALVGNADNGKVFTRYIPTDGGFALPTSGSAGLTFTVILTGTVTTLPLPTITTASGNIFYRNGFADSFPVIGGFEVLEFIKIGGGWCVNSLASPESFGFTSTGTSTSYITGPASATLIPTLDSSMGSTALFNWSANSGNKFTAPIEGVYAYSLRINLEANGGVGGGTVTVTDTTPGTESIKYNDSYLQLQSALTSGLSVTKTAYLEQGDIISFYYGLTNANSRFRPSDVRTRVNFLSR